MPPVIKKAYNSIHVFPNPASTFTTFEWKLPLMEHQAVLSVLDVNGKIILNQPIRTKEGQWMWDTRNMASGVYFYEIKDDTGRLSSGKVVIKN